MSAHTSNNQQHLGHADAHHRAGQPHEGSLSDYVKGFVLSVILTAIPFLLVMGKMISDKKITVAVVLAFAALQVIVHMRYFLHLTGKAEGGWKILSLIFTVTLLVIMFSGSVWVMYHLDTNMMPASMSSMRNMP